MRRAALIISVCAVLLVATAAAAVVAGFPDVPDNHVHADGIAWAAENNLMRGYNNGNFGPDDPVTRGQLSTIFHRYDNTLDDSGSGGGTQGPPGPKGDPGTPGAPGTNAQVTAEIAFDTIPLADGLNIGGPIDTNHTPLPNTTVSLPAGDYLIQVYGAFQIPGDGSPVECDSFVAGNDGVNVWPQLTFWRDLPLPGNTAGEFDGGEGFISPNVIMNGCNERHVNVSGEIVISLDATTSVGLVAFGYSDFDLCDCNGIIQGGGGIIIQPLGELVGVPELPPFEGEGGPG